MNDTLVTALRKFALDFAEGAMAGAVAAFETATPDQLVSSRTLVFIVVLGAIDGAISAARRAIVAAKPA